MKAQRLKMRLHLQQAKAEKLTMLKREAGAKLALGPREPCGAPEAQRCRSITQVSAMPAS
jgi:hypothetical protein